METHVHLPYSSVISPNSSYISNCSESALSPEAYARNALSPEPIHRSALSPKAIHGTMANSAFGESGIPSSSAIPNVRTHSNGSQPGLNGGSVFCDNSLGQDPIDPVLPIQSDMVENFRNYMTHLSQLSPGQDNSRTPLFEMRSDNKVRLLPGNENIWTAPDEPIDMSSDSESDSDYRLPSTHQPFHNRAVLNEGSRHGVIPGDHMCNSQRSLPHRDLSYQSQGHSHSAHEGYSDYRRRSWCDAHCGDRQDPIDDNLYDSRNPYALFNLPKSVQRHKRRQRSRPCTCRLQSAEERRRNAASELSSSNAGRLRDVSPTRGQTAGSVRNSRHFYQLVSLDSSSESEAQPALSEIDRSQINSSSNDRPCMQRNSPQFLDSAYPCENRNRQQAFIRPNSERSDNRVMDSEMEDVQLSENRVSSNIPSDYDSLPQNRVSNYFHSRKENEDANFHGNASRSSKSMETDNSTKIDNRATCSCCLRNRANSTDSSVVVRPKAIKLESGKKFHTRSANADYCDFQNSSGNLICPRKKEGCTHDISGGLDNCDHAHGCPTKVIRENRSHCSNRSIDPPAAALISPTQLQNRNAGTATVQAKSLKDIQNSVIKERKCGNSMQMETENESTRNRVDLTNPIEVVSNGSAGQSEDGGRSDRATSPIVSEVQFHSSSEDSDVEVIRIETNR